MRISSNDGRQASSLALLMKMTPSHAVRNCRSPTRTQEIYMVSTNHTQKQIQNLTDTEFIRDVHGGISVTIKIRVWRQRKRSWNYDNPEIPHLPHYLWESKQHLPDLPRYRLNSCRDLSQVRRQLALQCWESGIQSIILINRILQTNANRNWHYVSLRVRQLQ